MTQYAVDERKVLETLVWVAHRRPEKGFYYILSVLFYADKFHLQAVGSPVLGDTYIKMNYGPVASLAYEMLQNSDRTPVPILEEIERSLEIEQWKYPCVTAKREPNAEMFSATDIQALDAALEYCDAMSLDELCEKMHQEKAWIEASMNAEMDYEAFIDDDIEKRDELLARIREGAAYSA